MTRAERQRFTARFVEPQPAELSSEEILPDLLAPGLLLVFCGTAASTASAAARAYYAKPGNRFWPSLHRAGITPRQFAPAEFPLLAALGIGLTDLCKHHSGTDAALPAGAFDVAAFRSKVERFQPRMLAFTSKNAGKAVLGRQPEYGLQPERIGETAVYVLPSPSGLATRFFDLREWQALGAELTALRAREANKR